jgi:hypothetical protein
MSLVPNFSFNAGDAAMALVAGALATWVGLRSALRR